jgi:uncharacterized membrane protein/glutaredoxin
LISVTLYTRPGCHLCVEVKEQLQALQSEYPHRLVEVDIDQDAALAAKYGEKIPVLEIGPYRLEAPMMVQQLRVTLGAAQDRQKHLDDVEQIAQEMRRKRQGGPRSATERFSYWLMKHYMAVFNTFFLVYLGLPFLAPVLMHAGATGPARVIYNLYGAVCHQLAFRSVFLYGEQAIYPRSVAAAPGEISYEQATGKDPNTLVFLDNDEIWEARLFIGNEEIGFKVALCQRDIAIYGGIFLFGLAFSLIGRKWPPLPIWAWVIFGMLPMGMDGFSQLVGQINLPLIQQWIPYRESTLGLRLFTGFLFGVTTAWIGYPYAEAAMRETRTFLEVRLAPPAGRAERAADGLTGDKEPG